MSRSSNVVPVTRTVTGSYCVNLARGVPASHKEAVATPYRPADNAVAGTPGTVAHAEFDGNCGSNGIAIVTFVITNGSTVTSHDEPFFNSLR